MMIAVKTGKQNRRRSLRKQLRSAIKVQCRKGSFGFGQNIFETFLDLSEGGVRLIIKAPLELGDEVEVRLEGLNVIRPVVRVAKVVWSLPLESGHYCVGFQFAKNLAFADLQRLTKS
jgi:PilZ domain